MGHLVQPPIQGDAIKMIPLQILIKAISYTIVKREENSSIKNSGKIIISAFSIALVIISVFI